MPTSETILNRVLATLTVEERANSGDFQLTWDGDYRIGDAQLGLKGALLADLDLRLKPRSPRASWPAGWPRVGSLAIRLGDISSHATCLSGVSLAEPCLLAARYAATAAKQLAR